jgi:hypothetical protein
MNSRKNRRKEYEVKGCITRNMKHELVKQLQKADGKFDFGVSLTKNHTKNKKGNTESKCRRKGEYYFDGTDSTLPVKCRNR